MNEKTENEAKTFPPKEKQPVYWIPFSIAAVFLVVVGLFRFPSSEDNSYFIYICLIAFALAALPWITSFRVNGLFEIERAIEKTKDETRDRIEQTDKRFEDRLFSLRAELVASLTSIQSQVAQQSSILNSTQSQVSQQTSRQSTSNIIAIGESIKHLDEIKKISEDETISEKKEIIKSDVADKRTVDLPQTVEVSRTDFNELKAGFAQSAAAALDDPIGLKCTRLIRQIPDAGLPIVKIHEFRIGLEITDEQFQNLKTLKLIQIAPAEKDQNETVMVTNLGKIYSDYWKLSADISSLLPTFSNIALSLIPVLGPALAGLWIGALPKSKKEETSKEG